MSNEIQSNLENIAKTAENTQDRVKDHLRAAGSEVRAGARAAKDEVRELGNAARDKASESIDAMKDEWHHALDRGQHYALRGESMVRRNPWAALGIAAGVGFVLAKLLSHR